MTEPLGPGLDSSGSRLNFAFLFLVLFPGYSIGSPVGEIHLYYVSADEAGKTALSRRALTRQRRDF